MLETCLKFNIQITRSYSYFRQVVQKLFKSIVSGAHRFVALFMRANVLEQNSVLMLGINLRLVALAIEQLPVRAVADVVGVEHVLVALVELHGRFGGGRLGLAS